MWRLTEKLSGEDWVTKRAVNLFYGQIDNIIKKRLDAIEHGYKPDPDAGVYLLDLFMESTKDIYTLGGMVFSFLSAGRKSNSYQIDQTTNDPVCTQVIRPRSIFRG